MADEYTPTTGNVRSVYAYGGAGQAEDRRRAQFDRWLATHDRAVKAEALRGAAEDFTSPIDPTCHLTTEGRKFIRARADQIEGAAE